VRNHRVPFTPIYIYKYNSRYRSAKGSYSAWPIKNSFYVPLVETVSTCLFPAQSTEFLPRTTLQRATHIAAARHSPLRSPKPYARATMPRLATAAATATARRAGEVLRRCALGGLRPFSSLQPSQTASASDEVTEIGGKRDVPSLTLCYDGPCVCIRRFSWKARPARAPPCSTAPLTSTPSPQPLFVLPRLAPSPFLLIVQLTRVTCCDCVLR
jgi:hypothetical protein